MSGHDLARMPGLCDQRDCRLGEMPMLVRPNSSAQPVGSKRSRDGLGPSYSANSISAAPPSNKLKMSEIEIQTAETSETPEKREKDWQELCAKLDKDKKKAKERDEMKSNYDKLLASSPANTRNTILDPSDTYLAPRFQKTFGQVAKATMQDIGSTIPYAQASHPSGERR